MPRINIHRRSSYVQIEPREEKRRERAYFELEFEFELALDLEAALDGAKGKLTF